MSYENKKALEISGVQCYTKRKYFDESDKIMAKNSTSTMLAKLLYSSMFLALAMLLPFLTGSVSWMGSSFLPMHLPVIICGFACGQYWGLAVGAVAPLLRFALFGAPTFANAIAMAFELATYAFVSGMLYKKLDKTVFMYYVTLITSMVCGRLVWGVVMFVLIFLGIGSGSFTLGFIWSSTVVSCLPGILFQLIFVPLIVNVFRQNHLILN